MSEHNKRITLLVTEEEFDEITEASKYTSLSKSQYVRLMYVYGRHATAHSHNLRELGLLGGPSNALGKNARTEESGAEGQDSG